MQEKACDPLICCPKSTTAKQPIQGSFLSLKQAQKIDLNPNVDPIYSMSFKFQNTAFLGSVHRGRVDGPKKEVYDSLYDTTLMATATPLAFRPFV